MDHMLSISLFAFGLLFGTLVSGNWPKRSASGEVARIPRRKPSGCGS